MSREPGRSREGGWASMSLIRAARSAAVFRPTQIIAMPGPGSRPSAGRAAVHGRLRPLWLLILVLAAV
jgi:hypothetical protein